MSDHKPRFKNEILAKAVDSSSPWLDSWKDFRESVVQDVEAFESMLNEKEIPIVTWVDVGSYGRLGWATFRRDGYLRLLFHSSKEFSKPKPLVDCSLEIKILAFPYLSELSYQLCSRIKLAHTSHHIRDRLELEYLESINDDEPKNEASSAPFKILTYA